MLEELQPGKVFQGRYEIVRCIRAGGMGAVYEVVHLETKPHRALKVMLPTIVRDESMRNRFRLEAQVTADVESDHIVETFDAGVDLETGAPFLVMELLRGEDLAHHLHARGRLPPEEVVGVLSQLARALEQTHASGIVHRDLKPENLFIATRGEDPPRIKVLDFGIAKIVAQSSAQGGTTSLGTPLYMAPEQFSGGDVSARTDLFTVGHIAFTLLTGEHYWEEEASSIGLLPLVERLSRGVEELPTHRAERSGVILPAAFDAWFLRSTARVPAERFERARDQVAALADALGVPLERATVPTPRHTPAGKVVRRPSLSELQTLSAANGRGGTSPLSASAPFAPTSVSGEVDAATLVNVVTAGEPDRATEVLERANVATHHASVQNIPATAGGRATTRVVAAAAAVVVGGLLAFTLLRSRAQEPNVTKPIEPPAAATPADATPAAATPAPPDVAPATHTASVASTPAVTDVGSAARPIDAPSPSSPSPPSSAASPASPRVVPTPRVPLAPATAKPSSKPKVDPSKVFD
jgi:serine/threonine-protein kinase